MTCDEIGDGSNLYIHVGPGKTGSSAIQNWLQNNRAHLKKAGFVYPRHRLDVNGVSSGNLDILYSGNDSGGKSLDLQKCVSFKNEMISKSNVKFILSSEFFYRDMINLHEQFPNANFIFYLREPISSMESNYNQSVKRHYQLNRFALPEKARAPQLGTLEKYLEVIDLKKVCIRFYEKSVFRGGNIISDFLDAIGCKELKCEIKDKQINPSYGIEALELKRAFNVIKSRGLHGELDNILQGYPVADSNFSMIRPSDFRKYRTGVIEIFERFFDKFEIDGKKFVEAYKSAEPKPFKNQANTDEGVTAVLNYVKANSAPAWKIIEHCFAQSSLFIMGNNKIECALESLLGKPSLLQRAKKRLRNVFMKSDEQIIIEAASRLALNLKGEVEVNSRWVESQISNSMELIQSNKHREAYVTLRATHILKPSNRKVIQLANFCADQIIGGQLEISVK